MLSILIAQYNYDVRSLAEGLFRQAAGAGIRFEIIIVDDCSEEKYINLNKKIHSKENIKIIRNSKNTGRAATRNLLAEKAQFNNLLFIDCDAGIYTESFIQNYLTYIDDYDVICGGTAYDKSFPGNNFMLRWKYGVKREEIPGIKRSVFPYRSFSSFNFLIRKELFLKSGFDSSIRKYGHEDTLFGIQLLKNKIKLRHINNPLIHRGVEDNSVFLKKSIEALDNLFYLYNDHPLNSELIENTKILRHYKKYRSIHFIFRLIYKFSGKTILKNLLGKNPNLLLFDIYKLAYLCTL